MLSTVPYNPTTQDLFLYEDHVVTWTVPTAGSTTVKRPYAWNPNCSLYGYRRSLEGLVATYRTFSTDFGSPALAPQVNAANPKANPVNTPMWFNSFPPTAKVISPRMMHWCAHCYDIGSIAAGDRVAGAMLNTMYAEGSYLDAILNLRFIDGDNNIVEIPKTQCERPYLYDSAGGIAPSGLGSVGSPFKHDVAAAVLSQPFPFNPLTVMDAGSVTSGSWRYINAGNMFLQDIWFRSVGFRYDAGVSGTTPNLRGNHAVYSRLYDRAFLHDSGSIFLREIKPPTSVAEGDGVMGIALGHLEFSPPLNEGSQEWITGTPPFTFNGVAMYPAKQPAFPQRVDAYYAAFMAYWTARGFPFPDIAEGSWLASYDFVTQTQAQSLQTIAAAMRSSSFA